MARPASAFSWTMIRYSKTARIAHAAANSTASDADRPAVVISGSAVASDEGEAAMAGARTAGGS
jgi:hypothetical protein